MHTTKKSSCATSSLQVQPVSWVHRSIPALRKRRYATRDSQKSRRRSWPRVDRCTVIKALCC